MNDRLTQRPSRSQLPSRSGQAMVEFAIISFVLTAMLAGFLVLISVGLSSFQNNIAAESAGRLLDRNEQLTRRHFNEQFGGDPNYDPDADLTAEQVYRFLNEFKFARGAADTTLYDESKLILSPDEYFNQRSNSSLPLLNNMLLGQFIFDPDLEFDPDDEKGGYRFPGAVVKNIATGERTVLIPIIDYFDAKTNTTAIGIARTLNVKTFNPDDAIPVAFPVAQNWVAPVTITTAQNGFFKVIIFTPSQPGASIELRITRDEEGRMESQRPVAADDSMLASQLDALPTGYEFATPSRAVNVDTTVNRGKYGLGEVFMSLPDDAGDPDNIVLEMNTYRVRPYRRVFETASVFHIRPETFTVQYERSAASPPATPPIITIQGKDSIQAQTETPVAPFNDYQFKGDQMLDLAQKVIDRGNEDLPMMQLLPPALPNPPSATNDFHQRVLIVPELLGEERWTAQARLALEPDSLSMSWMAADRIELRLYRNGVFQGVFATQVVTAQMASAGPPVVDVAGRIDILAKGGDYLQVRIFLEPFDPQNNRTFSAKLTVNPSRNWVLFHHETPRNP